MFVSLFQQNEMRSLTTHKKLMVQFVIAVLAMSFTVKAVHIYHCCLFDEPPVCAGEPHPLHDSSTCPVCQFTFPPFTEAAFVSGGYHRLILVNVIPVVYSHHRYCQPVYLSYTLRAPPAA
jgi:hypothetical protein